MESKALSPETANLLARLKPKQGKAEHRVPIEPVKTEDTRRSRRQSACIQGSINAERLSEAVPCVIRDLSATGARLEIVKGDRKAFTSEEWIPDRFMLAFRLERTEVDCEIIWQKGGVIGVRFLSLPRQA
ncbi:MAG: PilZ domain-containing protein [Hyphomicrobiaceae bacterium]